MRLVRAIVGSTKGRVVLAIAAAILAFQAWLSMAAPGKIAPGFPPEGRRVNIIVTLPFPPERFHIGVFQAYGRVSGTRATPSKCGEYSGTTSPPSPGPTG